VADIYALGGDRFAPLWPDLVLNQPCGGSEAWAFRATERRSFEEEGGVRPSRHRRHRPALRYMRIDASCVRGTR